MTISRRSMLTAGSAFAAATFVSRSASAAPAWEARSGLDAAAYQAKFDQMTGAGFRPVVVDGYSVGGQPQFAAIWRKTGGPAWVARHGLDGAAYQQNFNHFTQAGYRPVWVSPYQDGGVKYAVIFSKGGPNQWIARHGLKQTAFQAEFDQNVANGYRLVNVGVAGGPLMSGATYAGIWEPSNGMAWEARSGLSASDYQAKFEQMTAQGFRPRQVCGYTVLGQPRFAAIWEKTNGPAWEARHNLTTAQFQQKFDALNAQGFWLTDVSGYETSNGVMFAGIWEKAP